MEDAKKTLMSFFEEMNIWNDETHDIIMQEEEDLEQENIQKIKLIDILSKYSTPSNIEKEIGLVCGNPSEYSVETQQIYNCEILTRNKIFIYTEQTNRFQFKYRYTLVRKNNRWLIDKKHWFSKSKEKWIKDLL